MSGAPALVWLRREQRLTDNPALLEAAPQEPVIPVFIWHDDDDRWAPGPASRWWQWHSLQRLAADLDARGSRLVIRRGPPVQELAALVAETGAGSLHVTRTLDPHEPTAPSLESALAAAGGRADVIVHPPNLLFGPPFPTTKEGSQYLVFTPFWRACQSADPPDRPKAAPDTLPAPSSWPRSIALDELRADAVKGWAGSLDEAWSPGEAGAARQLDRFLAGPLERYADERDRPDHRGTSRLSPYLHFGEISVRTVWHAAVETGGDAAEPFLRQLAWREFAHQLLLEHPGTIDEPLREEFEAFPWQEDPEHLSLWQRGQTGYPLVDAGMRELWETGWMHNRVRLVCASFLTKHLLLPWQEGASWFWQTLVDADLADNTLGWQWTAGCGADAAPYFRIFNPVLQSRRYDPDAAYVRRWLPELTELPDRHLHAPWQAPEKTRTAAGVRLVAPAEVSALTDGDPGPRPLGEGRYPEPVVDHKAARRRALDAYDQMRSQ